MKIFVVETRSVTKTFVFANSEQDIKTAFVSGYKKGVVVAADCSEHPHPSEIITITESTPEELGESDPEVLK